MSVPFCNKYILSFNSLNTSCIGRVENFRIIFFLKKTALITGSISPINSSKVKVNTQNN